MSALSITQIFNNILSQFLENHPSYKTWLTGIQSVHYDEASQTFYVELTNRYARDWCERHAGDQSDLAQDLAGALGMPCHIRYVHGAIAPTEEDIPDQTLTLEVEEDLYNRIVRPQAVTVLPGYFRRWIPVLGPELAWLYVGFYQAAYSCSTGGEKHIIGHFTSEQIAFLSGCHPVTIRKRIRKSETWQRLRGLVERIDAGQQQWVRKEDGRPHKAANRYRIHTSLPLTPTDAIRLEDWLRENIPQDNLQSILKALNNLSPDTIFDTYPTAEGEPRTIEQVVNTCFPTMPKQATQAIVDTIESQLRPSKDIIVITHFFVQNILPLLGEGPAWLYVLLRDRCWEGENTRSATVVNGGYAEIANWLGLSRPKTIYEWLNDKSSLFRCYVSADKTGSPAIGDKWSLPRSFNVLLHDIPLETLGAYQLGIETTAYIRQTGRLGLLELAPEDFEQHPQLAAIASVLDDMVRARDTGGASDTNRVAQTLQIRWRERYKYGGANATNTVARTLQSGGANATNRVARTLQSGGANATVKSLKSLVKSSLSSGVNPPPSQNSAQSENTIPNEATNSAAVTFTWSILDKFNISQESRKKIIESNLQPWNFVSWLL
ncbi:MAG: hypothetical protein QXQ66_10195, partial [Candidatus Hadarchaeum sp.]|uniref:hypothetical protein n=1 Tax=Candidatus Hadarchaeum sp. TaxID=2883567 RepID=UPI003179CBBD